MAELLTNMISLKLFQEKDIFQIQPLKNPLEKMNKPEAHVSLFPNVLDDFLLSGLFICVTMEISRKIKLSLSFQVWNLLKDIKNSLHVADALGERRWCIMT